MRLKITLEYFTSPGEELILVLSDGKSIAMEYVAGGRWEASFDVPSDTPALEYSFELHRGGQCVRREWGHHSVPEPVVRQGSPTTEDLIVEPSKEALIATLLPKVIRLRIFTTLLDSAAAEHAARTVAMQLATDNGNDLLQELTLEYNKGRQQKITSEILDLVGGSLQ